MIEYLNDAPFSLCFKIWYIMWWYYEINIQLSFILVVMLPISFSSSFQASKSSLGIWQWCFEGVGSGFLNRIQGKTILSSIVLMMSYGNDQTWMLSTFCDCFCIEKTSTGMFGKWFPSCYLHCQFHVFAELGIEMELFQGDILYWAYLLSLNILYWAYAL